MYKNIEGKTHRDLKYRERMFRNFVDKTSPSFSADETFHSTVYLVTFDGRFLKDSAFKNYLKNMRTKSIYIKTFFE
jgi:hypothetical protein